MQQNLQTPRFSHATRAQTGAIGRTWTKPGCDALRLPHQQKQRPSVHEMELPSFTSPVKTGVPLPLSYG